MARAAARISSEHVARVFDVGSLASGAPYIAMEFLEGADIGELLARHGRLPASDTVEFVLQACEALAEAHAAGIVHRDLKPGNLFLANRLDGQRLIKVLDFGISKMSGVGGSAPGGPMTHTSALMGSPLYMSPEQLTSSKNVDARSDIWSLGVVMFEMLSGSQPFQGETLPQVCMSIMTAEPARLDVRAPGTPPLLVTVVDRCLQKRLEARYQSVAELAQALLPLASARGQQSVDRISRVLGVALSASSPALPGAGAAGFDTSPAVSVTPGTYAAWGETKSPLKQKPRSQAPLFALLAAVLAVMVGGGVLAVRHFASAPALASAKSSQEATSSNSPAAEPVVRAAPSATAPPAPLAPLPAATASAAAAPSAAAVQLAPPSAPPKNNSKTAAHSAAPAPKAKPVPHVAAATPAAPTPEPAPVLVTTEAVQNCTGTCAASATSASCVAASCGDGQVEAGEQCDDKNADNSDACVSGCKNATCGDGFVWQGKEVCDYNNAATANLCARSCELSIWALWPMPDSNGAHAPSYDTTLAGVVTDNVTKLIWQRAVDVGSYSWADAAAYCGSLSLAGFTDWRLPTRIELVSILGAGFSPSIDMVAFPSTPSAEFWTSSAAVFPPSSAFAVGFTSATTDIDTVTKTYRARCVR